jgi:PD-(D/E)XK endonuclease
MPRPRTWTDENLCMAVSSADSWASVARQLGLPARGQTTKRLRRHAARLNLDTSHLPARTEVQPQFSPEPGNPKRLAFSPEVAQAAIEESRSWAQVAEKLGISKSMVYRQFKDAAQVAGLDLSRLAGQAWGSTPVDALPVPFTRPFDPAQLHRMGTAVATAWFAGRGYVVSVPTEPACYDLVVESDTSLQRVQVKTSRGGQVGITKTQYGTGTSPSTGKYGQRPYRADEIDFFFIFTATGTMYLIPIAAVEGKSVLALTRYRRYQLPGLTECSYSNLAERSG